MTLHILDLDLIPKDVIDISPAGVIEAFVVCNHMEKICKEHEGLGLAAVQIGAAFRLFVIALDGEFRYFANCMYEPSPESKKVTQIEGCLSLPNRFFMVERWEEVRVIGDEIVVEDGHPVLKKHDMLSSFVAFQHEIDHQNGLLVSDVGREMFVHQRKNS